MIKVKKVDFSVEDRIRGCEYLGCGCSKEAYYDEKKNVVIKVPRGRYLVPQDLEYSELPETNENLSDIFEKIDSYDERLTWSLGQFIMEIITWNAFKELSKEGINGLDCLAEIKDYYIDKNNVMVIEQEYTTEFPDEEFEDGVEYDIYDVKADDVHELCLALRELREPLEKRFKIVLSDIRAGNCGYDEEGTLKLYDFGLSSDYLQVFTPYSDFHYGSFGYYSSSYYEDED